MSQLKKTKEVKLIRSLAEWKKIYTPSQTLKSSETRPAAPKASALGAQLAIESIARIKMSTMVKRRACQQKVDSLAAVR